MVCSRAANKPLGCRFFREPGAVPLNGSASFWSTDENHTAAELLTSQVRVCARRHVEYGLGMRKAKFGDRALSALHCQRFHPMRRRESQRFCNFSDARALPTCSPQWAYHMRGGPLWGRGVPGPAPPYMEACFPDLFRLRSAFLAGELALAKQFPDRVLLLRHEDLFGEPPAAAIAGPPAAASPALSSMTTTTTVTTTAALQVRPALRVLMGRLAGEFGLPRNTSTGSASHPRDTDGWNWRALTSYHGFNGRQRARARHFESWADLAVRHPALLPLFCAGVDRALETVRGYGASMDALAAVCG
jgi:hypothetical protein